MLEGELKTGKVSFEEKESASGNFCSPLQVDPSVHFDQFIVSSDVKIKLRLCAVNTVDRIAGFIGSFRDVRVQNIGN